VHNCITSLVSLDISSLDLTALHRLLLEKDVGYVEDSLNLLKLSVKKVTLTQVAGQESIITLPNTRECQDQLMMVARASQYFSITQHGAVMTSSDRILALEHKQMLAKAKKLEKKKVNNIGGL
jgi:hypothetical protein